MTFFLAPRPAFLQVLRFALAGPQELARALEALRDLAQWGVLGEDARAQACHDAVLARLIADGHYPFRLASLAMGQLPAPKDATGAVLASIKAVLDPAQVLSPGRYEFPR